MSRPSWAKEVKKRRECGAEGGAAYARKALAEHIAALGGDFPLTKK